MKNFIAMAALAFGLAACSATSGGDKAQASDSTATKTDTVMNTTPTDSGAVKVEVETTAGNFTVLLYGDTPKHRDNFVKLAQSGQYNGTLFHRVIKNFMVQAGDPDSKDAPAGKMLGSGDIGEKIDAEIVYPRHFHKRGALAAARQGDQVNPQRKSSGSQFYVVTGEKYSQGQLGQMERQMEQRQMQDYFNQLAQQHQDEIRTLRLNRDSAGIQALQQKLIDQTEAWAKTGAAKMTPEMRQAYTTVGGTPHLDNQYTVFGEVISGMDVIDKIQQAETDRNDRPNQDIKILGMKVLSE